MVSNLPKLLTPTGKYGAIALLRLILIHRWGEIIQVELPINEEERAAFLTPEYWERVIEAEKEDEEESVSSASMDDVMDAAKMFTEIAEFVRGMNDEEREELKAEMQTIKLFMIWIKAMDFEKISTACKETAQERRDFVEKCYPALEGMPEGYILRRERHLADAEFYELLARVIDLG